MEFAGLEIDASEIDGGFPLAVDSVKIAVLMNGGCVLGGNALIGPNDVAFAVMDAQEVAAELVSGRDEDQVINDHGIGAEDEVFVRGADGVIEINFAVSWIDCTESAAGEEEGVTLASDSGRDG